MIESLNKLKDKKFFQDTKEWNERGLNPSAEITIEKMKLTVNDFIDFLIQLYQSQPTHQKVVQSIQNYFDELDVYDFDTEEREFIFDEFFWILREIKIYPNEFLV
jgi:hypothetical protein